MTGRVIRCERKRQFSKGRTRRDDVYDVYYVGGGVDLMAMMDLLLWREGAKSVI
jgi:hypothetical protein